MVRILAQEGRIVGLVNKLARGAKKRPFMLYAPDFGYGPSQHSLFSHPAEQTPVSSLSEEIDYTKYNCYTLRYSDGI